MGISSFSREETVKKKARNVVEVEKSFLLRDEKLSFSRLLSTMMEQSEGSRRPLVAFKVPGRRKKERENQKEEREGGGGRASSDESLDRKTEREKAKRGRKRRR